MPTETRELYKSRLKSGVHVGPDFTKPAAKVPYFDPVTREKMGEKDVYPEVSVKRGETYYSEEDLAAKDPARWEAVGEKRSRSRVSVTVQNPVQLAAPQGQVSDGFQRSTGNPAPDAGSAAGVAPPETPVVGPTGNRSTVGEQLGLDVHGPEGKDAAKGDEEMELDQLTKAELLEEAERVTGAVVSHSKTKAELIEMIKDAGKTKTDDEE